MIRLLATDIDNTLFCHETHEIPLENLRAIHDLQESGVKVALATARISMGIENIAQQLELEKYDGLCICSAGAEVIECKTKIRHQLHGISLDLIHRLFDFAKQHQLVLSVQQRDLMIATAYNQSLEFDRVAVGIDTLVVGSDYFRYIKEPAGMAALTADPARLDEIEELTRASFSDLSFTRSDPLFLDIVPAGVSKASAIKKVCDLRGWKLSEVAAIGDGENDIPMLKEVGFSAAVGSGNDKAKQVAQVITCTCQQSAVADFIDHTIMPYNKRIKG